jgi:hypothetical protein
MSLSLAEDRAQAAALAGAVWQAVQMCGGQHAAAFRPFRAAFDAPWLATLHLPPWPGQPVAMPGADGLALDRYTDPEACEAAYRERPRTRVYEDIGWGEDGTWAALAGQHLTRLAGVGPRATVRVYESAWGDQEHGVHRDGRLGIIVQLAGAKSWQAGQGLDGTGPGGVQKVTVSAGDVLVVPGGLPHLATTPPDPGRSVHLAFAVGREPTSGFQG